MQEFITKAQFKLIESHFIVNTGRPKKYDTFLVLNAILYILKGGIQWRLLPPHYPPFGVVYYHFSKWKKNKVFHSILASLTRRKDNRLLLIDNQSISDSDLPSNTHKGYDGHKKRKGRKRCVLTDTQGMIHCVKYFSANTHDTMCAKKIIEYYKLTPLGKDRNKKYRIHNPITVYGDKGFHSPDIKEWCRRYRVHYHPLPRMKQPNLSTRIGYQLYKEQYGYLVDSIKKVRWVVERTFAWLQKYRRLNMNYERTTSSLEAMTILAGIRMILRKSY